MITNERQYKITRNKAAKFEGALEKFDARRDNAGVHPRLVEAERKAMEAQLADLQEEIEAYELLRSGRSEVVVVSIDGLAEGLINARIALGLSQRQLAERIGLRQQQIQRYEAEGYMTASYKRLLEVAHELGFGSNNRFSVQLKVDRGGIQRH